MMLRIEISLKEDLPSFTLSSDVKSLLVQFGQVENAITDLQALVEQLLDVRKR